MFPLVGDTGIEAPGASTGTRPRPPRSRLLDATAPAFDRARDGWLMHRLTEIRPATAIDPGLYEAETFPASSSPAFSRVTTLSIQAGLTSSSSVTHLSHGELGA